MRRQNRGSPARGAAVLCNFTKSVCTVISSIGIIQGIALFLYLPIVQNAKKCYAITNNELSGETKCHGCDWISCLRT